MSLRGFSSVLVCPRFLFYEDSSHIGLGPTLVTPFELTCLFKDHISKYGLQLGVKALAYELLGDAVQSIMVVSP